MITSRSKPSRTSSSAGRSPDVVVPWASERLVLITAEMASVVDLVSGLVADQFLVEPPLNGQQLGADAIGQAGKGGAHRLGLVVRLARRAGALTIEVPAWMWNSLYSAS